jgi:hypothetical protein
MGPLDMGKKPTPSPTPTAYAQLHNLVNTTGRPVTAAEKHTSKDPNVYVGWYKKETDLYSVKKGQVYRGVINKPKAGLE